MTSTSTPRAGLSRLFNSLAALAFLFVVAGGASAQQTIFVDPNGGSDARNGLSRDLGTGNVGPKESIEGALAVAASGDTIVLLAGEYDDSRSLVNGGVQDGIITLDGVDGLTFRASSEGGQNRVVFTAPIALYSTGHTFTREGGATFALAANLVVGEDGGTTANPGSANLGSGIFAFGQTQTGAASGSYSLTINEGSLTGTPVITRAPTTVRYDIDTGTTYTAGAELPTGGFGSAIDVEFDGAAAGTLTIPSNVRLTDGASVNVDSPDQIAGGFEIVAGTGAVTFGDGGTAGGDGSYGSVTVTSGTLNVDDDLAVMTITLNGGNTDATGQTLTVMGSFVQNNGLFAAGGSIEFDGATGAIAFQPQSNLVVANLAIGDGTAPEPTSVTFLGDASVTGQFSVATGTTANLSGNAVRLTGATSTSVVNGTVQSGLVVFRQGGQTIGGTGTYDSISIEDFVAGSGAVSLAPGANIQFTGDLNLAGFDGLNTSTGADISPVGNNASLSLNVDDASNRITGTNFNGDNEEYDLSYYEPQDAATGTDATITYAVGSEFDLGEIENFEVTATDATIDASGATIPTGAGAEILGSFTVRNGDNTRTGTAAAPNTERTTVNLPAGLFEIAGATTIEDNAVVTANGTGLALSGAGNVLDGVIDGSTLILRNGVTVTGRATTATTGANSATAVGAVNDGQSEARIEADVLLANGATASLLQLRRIDGDITDEAAAAANAGTLTIGLIADSNPTGQDGAGEPDFTQDTNGNINGTVTLDFSTLAMASGLQFTEDNSTIRIATLNTGSFVFFTESVQGGANQDNDDGPSALILTNDVQGTGTVWPSSDLTISKSGTAPQTLTIAVFHPGDDDEDDITIASNILVTTTLRITGNLDADAADTGSIDYAVTVDGTGDNVANVIIDEGYAITEDTDAAGVTDNELIVNGPINLTTSEVGNVSPFTQNVLLGSEDVRTFMVMAAANLIGTDNDRDVDYTVENFVTATAGSLNLNGFDLAVRNDATLAADNALTNGSAPVSRVDTNGLVNFGFSTFSFIGDSTATLAVTPNASTGVATFGDGVDLRIAKSSTETTVTITGGSLVFDDEFGGGGAATDDDETLVLEQGILAVTSGNFIRLDHANAITGSSTSDNGQGFVFVPSNTDFPMSWISGDVRKRIISVSSSTANDRRNPGRVVYPVGADSSGSYAEYVLDFESITQSQSFGQRSVTVRFVDETAGGSRGLPIAYNGGSIDDIGNFYWLVRADPNLGSGTFFNVEARYDGFELRTDTNDDSDETISDLVLLQRQFGNAEQNPYSLVADSFANFIIERGDDQNPVVVAQNVEALLGGQGTIFTYGLGSDNRPVNNGNGPDLPAVLALKGNAPNPFRGRTTVAFDLPQSSEVSVSVFDVMGRQVMTLNKGTMAPGTNQTIEIDGSGLASGVYVYRLTAVGADNKPATLAGQITLAR